MFADIVADLEHHVPASKIAGRFLFTVAQMILEICELIRDQHGEIRVGLTGGVCQNVKLVERLTETLSSAKFEVLRHRRIPCNDGGLAIGQTMLARHKFARREKQ